MFLFFPAEAAIDCQRNQSRHTGTRAGAWIRFRLGNPGTGNESRRTASADRKRTKAERRSRTESRRTYDDDRKRTKKVQENYRNFGE